MEPDHENHEIIINLYFLSVLIIECTLEFRVLLSFLYNSLITSSTLGSLM